MPLGTNSTEGKDNILEIQVMREGEMSDAIAQERPLAVMNLGFCELAAQPL